LKHRFFLFLTILLTVSFFLAEKNAAAAQSAQQIEWCEGKNNASADQIIQGCTAMIQSRAYDGKVLAQIFELRGDAYLYAKGSHRELDPAIADYTEAIRLNPQDAFAFYARGDAYKVKAYNSSGSAAKQFTALSIKDFSENIRLSPKPTPLHYINRSNAYRLNGDYELAMGDLNEALRLDPLDKNAALVNRCQLYAILNRWPEAPADCNESLARKDNADQSPDRGPDSLNARGFVFLKMAKYKESARDYDAVLQYPKLSVYRRPNALYGRGMARLRSGDVANGNADIAAAKQADPHVAEEFARGG
jgi:tetratricopeptide (TPR) repeat protein